MKEKILIFSLVSLFFLSVEIQGQDKALNGREKLPSVNEPVTCELALRYIDDAISKNSDMPSSTLIIIIHMNDGESSQNILTNRIKNLKNYFRSRKISNYVIGLGDKTEGSGNYDLYVQGKLLYSIPIKKNDVLNLLSCFII